MGFTPSKIEAALRNSNGTLEDAIEWLEQNQSKLEAAERNTFTIEGDEDEGEKVESGNSVAGVLTQDQEQASKPLLTEEGKQAKLQMLKERATLRKAEETKKEAEEQKRNEALRKKRDVENIKAVEEKRRLEALKEVARKRQAAKADLEAKKRIKELIEADKKARQERNKPSASVSAPAPAPAPAPVASATGSQPKPNFEYTSSKIRFKVPGSAAPVLKTYALDVKLQDIADELSSEFGLSANQVQFTTTFPTKTYGKDDFNLTVKEANLINTNVIVKT